MMCSGEVPRASREAARPGVARAATTNARTSPASSTSQARSCVVVRLAADATVGAKGELAAGTIIMAAAAGSMIEVT